MRDESLSSDQSDCGVPPFTVPIQARHHVQDDDLEHRTGSGGFEIANGGSSGGRRSVRSAPGADGRSGGQRYRTNSLPQV